MQWWLGVVAFVALLTTAVGVVHAQPKGMVLSESAFAKEFERITAGKYPDATVTASGKQISVRWSDGSDATFFLANAYAKYRANPSQLEQVVLSHIAKPAEAMRQRDALLPVVRPQSWLDATRSQLRMAGASDEQIAASLPISIPLGADLVLVLAEDSEESVRFLAPDDLGQFKLASADEARAVAMENLRKKLPQLQIEGGDGRYRLHLDGIYESSMTLALNEKAWAGLGLKGHPIVAMPSRDTVLFCGSDDKESVATLRGYAKKIHGAADHAISEKLYELRDGRFEVVE